MFITKEEMEKRLSTSLHARHVFPAHTLNQAELSPPPKPENDSIPFDHNKFRKDGTVREKQGLDGKRAIVAATALMTSPQVAAEIFDVHPGYAKHLAEGEYSQAKDPEKREENNRKLREEIYEELGNIRDEARNKMMLVLGLINKGNLEAIRTGDKAKVAAQMANALSQVIDRTIHKSGPISNDLSSHLHLYAPERRELGDFTVKHIAANVPKDNEFVDVNSNSEGEAKLDESNESVQTS